MPDPSAETRSIPAGHAHALEQALAAVRAQCLAMPPVAAMGLEVARFERARLHMRAPLALNVNDKGSAFGGSLTSLMTFCGWGLATLQLALAGLEADVFVADSQVRYLRPLYAELQGEAWLEDGQSWELFASSLAERGRARVTLNARVMRPDGGDAATLAGRYVAIARG